MSADSDRYEKLKLLSRSDGLFDFCDRVEANLKAQNPPATDISALEKQVLAVEVRKRCCKLFRKRVVENTLKNRHTCVIF